MKKIRIFLASSNELKEERQLFESKIYRKSKKWIDKGMFLQLDIWEDLSAKMSVLGHSQKDYNEVVKQADIVVLLAYTKVGMYTAEEFETAYGQFQTTQKPFIFTYFKNANINTGDISDGFMTLLNFKNKLKKLGHFYSSYENFDDLWNQFNDELDMLENNEFKEVRNITIPSSSLNVKKLEAVEGISIKVEQTRSTTDFSDLKAGGKINIDVKND